MISEKTLELNVTHEILSLGDHFSYLLRWAGAHPWISEHGWLETWSRVGWQRPSYATGLTLADENRRGWDVRIEFPATPTSLSHALFLQFKAGRHRQYSRNALSAFSGTKSEPAPFCQFGLNNNSAKDQHIILKALATQPQLRGAVAYAFPRIPNAATLKACLGHLVHVTSFVTVDDLDTESMRSGICITSGNDHKFQTSYESPFAHEVCSEPKRLGKLPDSTGRILGEILACRIYRALNDAKTIAQQNEIFRRLAALSGKRIFRAFELELGKYLGVSSEGFATSTRMDLAPEEKEFLTAGVERYKKFESEYLRRIQAYEGAVRENGERTELFGEVASHLSRYRNFMEMPYWFDADIPSPDTKAALLIPREGLTVSFSESVDIPSEQTLARALKTISYQAF